MSIDNDRTVLAPDGSSIAYSVVGAGPALMLTNGLTTSSYFWKYLRPHWTARHTVITWDLPGHGQSGPARSDASASIGGLPAIMERVMQAAGVDRAVQLGWSVGCQIALEMYRQRPQRCEALVLLFGPGEHALRGTRLPVPGALLDALLRGRAGARFAELVPHAAQLARTPGLVPLLRRLHLVGTASDEDVHGLIKELLHVHPPTVRKLACSVEDNSGLDVLARVAVPVLIVAGDRDPFAPALATQRMHALAKGSEYIRLPEATHSALLDHVPQVGAAVDSFLQRTSGRPLSDRGP